jgi:nickel-type superoxide dismutase maturation protease
MTKRHYLHDMGAMTLPGVWPLRRVRVTGPSMAPALRHGDVLVVRRTRPGRLPRPGSVVVVELPGRPLAVKRLTRVEADGQVWVEGDNPFGSTDSRQLGALPADAVHARVVGRVWPRPRFVRTSP